MTLSQEDGQLYYKLWLPLLDFVNRKYCVNRKLKSIATAKELEPSEVKKVANKLWSDVVIIDDYLKECVDLGRDVLWCANATDNRSNVHAVPGCYYIRRVGIAL